MNRTILTILSAATLACGCGTVPADDVGGVGDTVKAADEGIDAIATTDAEDARIHADVLDAIADIDRPDTAEPIPDVPDDSESDDSAEDASVDGETADNGNLTDTANPCSHCFSGICDPETLQCLECTVDRDCGASRWCDVGVCRDWLCNPGAMFCAGTLLHRCSNNGGGFTVIRECADNDPCTDGDGCLDGRCVEGVRRTCLDENPCTIDYCGSDGGCEYYAAEGIVCDDENPCTEGDHCTGGKCVPGGSTDCSDLNPCTYDYCISMAGCIHEPGIGACGDSNGCTTDDRCMEGRCSGDQRDCDDGDPCTSDYCYNGSCIHQAMAGCLPCVDDQGCDDGDECTLDTCDTASGVCLNDAIRTDGCCLDMTDCPPAPSCLKPLCTTGHRCILGALQQSACCQTDILSQSFDDGWPGGWSADPESDGIGWRIGAADVPAEGITGPAAYFGNADEASFDNGLAVSGSFATPEFTLPAASAIRLSFLLWQDVEPLGGFDRFTVSVAADTLTGTKETVVWDRPRDFPILTAVDVDIDLSAFSGRTVRIVFVFDSIDAISNSGRGIYVDEIELTATCSPLPCIRDYHCKSAGFNGLCRDHKCDFQNSWMQVDEFGAPGSGAGTFLAPTDVVAMPGPEGRGSQILVADSKTHYIQVFEEDGTFVRIFGGYGVTPGRFLTPRGMQDSEGRVYITDSSGGRIQAMTAAGVFLYAFGSAGIDPGQFDTPRDVAVSPDGDEVYVADTGNHRISIFSRLGVYRYSFGAWGKTPGRFRTPAALAVAPDGRVWVCDTQNNRLQVFSPDGVLSMVVEPEGDLALYYPEGLAILKDGRVVVADTYNHRLVIFASDGTPIDVLGSFGEKSGHFNYPSDVDVLRSGSSERLVVADAGNFRISLWGLVQW